MTPAVFGLYVSSCWQQKLGHTCMAFPSRLVQRCEASELERLLSKGSLVDKDFGVTKVSKTSHIHERKKKSCFLDWSS